ncbi:Uncharacterized protein TCM_030052 [Theobroma cacao]|uniref:Cohesin subunit SCC3/SA HEAT-repeats domain-containing protein n=1 Tax=Theobroma cacao TaxID=3641 RepID=A0A061GN17_THECC|nr:Uncharacterized protein TCM_030052 [Theobroma cacao]
MDDDVPLASLFSTRHLERIRELGSNNGCPAVQAKPTGPEAKRTRASERDESLIGGTRCNTKEEFLDEANVGDVVVALVDLAGNLSYVLFYLVLFVFFSLDFVECYDDDLVSLVFPTLCSAPPRAYCQAALLMDLQLVTSLISVAKTLAEQRYTTQRQIGSVICMLLDENPLVELTEEDATNLIRLLSASVRKAVGEKTNFKVVVQLIIDAFFKHGEKDALRSCPKAIQFCCTESPGELQDFSHNKLKDLEDELTKKLKSAMKEVMLSGPLLNESLYEDIITVLHSFRNLDDEEFLAPKVISHFVMHGSSMVEIVNNLITVLKKTDDDISSIFLEVLKRRSTNILFESGLPAFYGTLQIDNESLRCKSFQGCEDLAVQLAGTFEGAAHNKHRSDFLKIVKEGIEYAFEDASKQLSFLEAAVCHFVSKLPISDVLDM